jgi:hypothetical protein
MTSAEQDPPVRNHLQVMQNLVVVKLAQCAMQGKEGCGKEQ